MAVASLVALLASTVARFLIIGAPVGAYQITTSAIFYFFFVLVLGAFFLPFLWWRTTVGYAGAVIVGILFFFGNTVEAVSIRPLLDAISLSVIVIPVYVFAVLLIAGSVLALRER